MCAFMLVHCFICLSARVEFKFKFEFKKVLVWFEIGNRKRKGERKIGKIKPGRIPLSQPNNQSALSPPTPPSVAQVPHSLPLPRSAQVAHPRGPFRRISAVPPPASSRTPGPTPLQAAPSSHARGLSPTRRAHLSAAAAARPASPFPRDPLTLPLTCPAHTPGPSPPRSATSGRESRCDSSPGWSAAL